MPYYKYAITGNVMIYAHDSDIAFEMLVDDLNAVLDDFEIEEVN